MPGEYKKICIKLLLMMGMLLTVSCISPSPYNPYTYNPIPLKELAWDPAVRNEHNYIYSHVLFVYTADTNLVLNEARKRIQLLRFTTSSTLELKLTRFSQSRTYTYLKVNERDWKNFDDLEYESYRVEFSTPPIPRQKISEGGTWKPRKSFIQFEIGHSKKNPRKTFILMERHWCYWTSGHIPATEIPFPVPPIEESFVLASDAQWLINLGKELNVNYTYFGDEMPFHKKAYKGLIE